MTTIPHQFVMPVAQLHPYLRECVRDLEKHGFCIVDDELIVDKSICTADQLEMFRESCRNVSSEKDRNLIIDDRSIEPKLLIMLADANKEGTLPEAYVEDRDGKGLLETVDGKPLGAIEKTENVVP